MPSMSLAMSLTMEQDLFSNITVFNHTTNSALFPLCNWQKFSAVFPVLLSIFRVLPLNAAYPLWISAQ